MDRRTALRKALAGYTPADAVERGFREEILGLLAAAGDPFNRGRFEPGHVTASGFVLSSARDRLLLLHHPTLGRWLQPGGHVEPADLTIQAASAREVLEETGVPVRAANGTEIFDLDVHGIPAHREAPAHRHFDVRFLWVAESDAIPRPAEAIELAWVPLVELRDRLESPSFARVHSKLALGAAGRLE